MHEKRPLEVPIDELLTGCRANDRAAQRQLFRRYREGVYSLIARTLGPATDLDEVAQQVFIRVFRSIDHFKGLSSFDTWVYRITAKVCIDQMRAKYRKRRLLFTFGGSETIEEIAAPSELDPRHINERRELSSRIRAALDKLEPEKKMAVLLFDVQGMTIGETAAILGIPDGTVKSRLFHARRELARHLKKYIDDDEQE